jgi:hypothetical protein
MSTKRKSVAMLVVGLVLVYVFTPFVAGLIGTYDRRGPKIFWEEHHEILYRIGYSFTHDDKPRVPFMLERAWFYGMVGKPMPRPAWMDSEPK